MKLLILLGLVAFACAFPTGEQPQPAEGTGTTVEDTMDDPVAAEEDKEVTTVIATPETEIPSAQTNEDEIETPVEEGPMVMETGNEQTTKEEDEVPAASEHSVRKQIGEMKMRFLHKANHAALKKILFRPAVLGFWRAAFKFDKNRQPISTSEWRQMWNVLNNYWSKHLGVKIPVTMENWMAVNKDKNGHISVKEEIIPTLFFEKDRFLFDVIYSALFHRVFDFNKNGLVDQNVFKTIKNNRLSEPKFYFQGVQWVKDIMALPTASAMEIQTELDEVLVKQGKEMAQEMVKNLKIDGVLTPKTTKTTV